MIKGRVLPHLATNLISGDFCRVLYTNSSKYFSGVGLLIAALGLAWLLTRHDTVGFNKSLLGGWFVATAVYFLVMGRGLLAPHVYYFLPILPLGSLGIAAFAEFLGGSLPVVHSREALIQYMLPVVALGVAAATIYLLAGYYDSIRPEVNLYLTAAKQLQLATKPDDLIIYDTEDTGLIYFIRYYSRRRGWHLWCLQKGQNSRKRCEHGSALELATCMF